MVIGPVSNFIGSFILAFPLPKNAVRAIFGSPVFRRALLFASALAEVQP